VLKPVGAARAGDALQAVIDGGNGSRDRTSVSRAAVAFVRIFHFSARGASRPGRRFNCVRSGEIRDQ